MQREGQLLNGRYQILERIGSGGMATVFKAHDRTLDRLVAVKLLHAGLTGDESFLRHFRQEARAAANLAHPNIVTVHDTGQDGDQYYIVMEFVEGKTLKQIIRHQLQLGQVMAINRALDLTIQICAGIGYAHRAGLVHCDVKPQNIIVTRDERVKVADFGIARAVSDASQEVRSVVWGTPQYLSPEQAEGKAATPASDVYAIGVILFELLTNRLPFQAESQSAMALKHLQEPAPPVTRFNPAVPPQIERIVSKLLAKEPASRYRTAGQLGRILATYRERGGGNAGMNQPTLSPRYPEPIGIGNNLSDTTPIRLRTPLPDAAKRPATAATTPTRPPTLPVATSAETGADWLTIGLGLIALVALLGLIPLWWLVFQAWTG
ncbi:MAG: serine/threonine protein kinase [Anaerolineales bacterium]|nr:serine/threonine protein kinase [Anaerolineales bacterium]MCB8951873.1 serine/threonine protein kinase [Ardenticatenales bacterium]